MRILRFRPLTVLLLLPLLLLAGGVESAAAAPRTRELIAVAPDKSRFYCESGQLQRDPVWVSSPARERMVARGSGAESRRLNRAARASKKRIAQRYRAAAAIVARGCASSERGEDNEQDGEENPPTPPVAPSPTPQSPPTPLPTPTVPPPDTTTSLTQRGITFTFDRAYPYGTFITGDYWVVGPVKILSITPHFTGSRNGFEVSPVSPGQQGFDVLANGFSASRVPLLPLEVAPGRSVIKSVGRENPSHAKLQTVAILTVVAAPPPADAFRPGYAAVNPPLYRLAGLKLDRLPSLPFSGVRPALSITRDRFSKPWIDHVSDWSGRAIHPFDHMPDYGASMTVFTNEAALRLLLDDPLESRRDAMIGYVQYGIDLRSMLSIGTAFVPNGGHCQGRIVPSAFAALLLDDPQFTTGLSAILERHHESGSIVPGVGGRALWGQPNTGGEAQYWRNQLADVDSRTVPDPYGFIDGGKAPGGMYDHCCNAQGFKGITLAFSLLPAMRQFWDDPLFFEYAKRWVSHGAWAQPDPCAPVDPRDVATCAATANKYQCPMNYYGITYGPDGHGNCIRDLDASDGIGRHPARHGTARDGGNWGSSFVNTMWTAFPPQ